MTSRKDRLLKEFNRTATMVEDFLSARYGKELSDTLRREASWEFEQIIPEIPHIKGLRARVFNTFLLATAQELAVYKAMAKHGKPPSEAWEVCHAALRLRVAEIPRWKRWVSVIKLPVGSTSPSIR